MGQKLRDDKIGSLSFSVSTITMSASANSPAWLTIGGQQYRVASSLNVVTSSLSANSVYFIYAVIGGGIPAIVYSVNSDSIGPAGYVSWKLLGTFYTNSSAAIAGIGSDDIWMPGKTYRVGDVVNFLNQELRCLVDHTSSTSILTDTAAARWETLTFTQNFVHNSNFRYNQRYGLGGNQTATGANLTLKAVDRWYYRFESSGGSPQIRTRNNNAVPPNGKTLYAFQGECIGGTTGTGVSQNHARTIMEKQDARKLLYGANGTFSIGFWYYCTKGGTHSVSLDVSIGGNAWTYTGTNALPFTVTANTWQYQTVTFNLTITGSGGGGENSDGLMVNIGPNGGGIGSNTTWTNGDYFLLTQVQVNPGYAPAQWTLAGLNDTGELQILQRYYEKSWNTDDAISTATNNGAEWFVAANSANQEQDVVPFKVRKRITNPSVVSYDPANPTVNVNYKRNYTTNNPVSGTTTSINDRVFVPAGTVVDGNLYAYHWTADADL